MLFWLPSYAKSELSYQDSQVEMIAIMYDVGTIFGSVTLGKISDKMDKKRSPVAFVSLIISSVLF